MRAIIHKQAIAFSVFGLLLVSVSCHTKNDTIVPNTIQVNEPSVFTCAPFDSARISSVLSLGWLQPVGHTIPTDHIYFSFQQNGSEKLTLYAPGSGLVMQILSRPVLGVPEVKVWIKMNNLFTYYLDHVVLDTSIKTGTLIKAGQVIGTTGQGNTIDFGAIDSTVTNSFINPARYFSQTIHCGKPLSYYTDPLKTKLYSLVDREGTEKDGWVCVDVPKTLSGNWFLDSTVLITDGPDGWDKELSFAYDIQHPQKLLVSIGGLNGMFGKWSILPSAMPPAQVTTASGKQSYLLWLFDPNYPNNPGAQAGLLIVQMIDEAHIKIEAFNNPRLQDAAFDGNAKIYAR